MAFANPAPGAIRELLAGVKTIAVVGYSPRPARPSNNISRAMQRYGFRIIPVRPGLAEGLGEKAWPDLAAVPERIDLVNVFRAGQHIPAIVDECLRLGLKTIWMQEGAVNEDAAERAVAGGMQVVMDRCILHDYTDLFMKSKAQG